MQTSFFSFASDATNDQNLQKMNLVTGKKFYIKHHKIVTQFFYIWFSTSAIDKGVFEATESEISYRNSVTIDHDNTKSMLVDI